MKTNKKLKKNSEKTATTTETRADNNVNVNYSQVVGPWPTASFTTDNQLSDIIPKPIYKYDMFGDNWTMVGFIYEKKNVPNWFRRLCTRFFLGTKWTKL